MKPSHIVIAVAIAAFVFLLIAMTIRSIFRIRDARRVRRRHLCKMLRDGFICVKCGYNVRGCKDACAECGWPIGVDAS